MLLRCERCISALRSAASRPKWQPEVMADNEIRELLASVSALEQCRDEVEFSWLRNFWAAGQRHSEINAWWTARIEELEAEKWNPLNSIAVRFREVVQKYKHAASKRVCARFEETRHRRVRLRKEWQTRYNDDIYDKYPVWHRPIIRPPLDIDTQ